MSLIAGNLAIVQRLLDGDQIAWAVIGGAAAHVYGDRRPLNDVDILVQRQALSRIVNLLQQSHKAVQSDGSRVIWRGIKVFDDLSVRQSGISHPFWLDDLMQERRRRMPLLGAQVFLAAPEDIVAHKLLLQRGPEQGKHDKQDAAGIIRRHQLDIDYLIMRLQRMNALDIVRPRLLDFGITIP
ncbi:MAG: hypothetical protein WHS83_13730 [Chloroflexus sp.]|uniref:hypothetical protein n=1 Tax=Chloroflexus sp. TaxID=1904827 RepID=UPI0021DE4503|nr:MAG: hypothetical protein KatS3mg056_1425 [Chloroflexus sp.]